MSADELGNSPQGLRQPGMVAAPRGASEGAVGGLQADVQGLEIDRTSSGRSSLASGLGLFKKNRDGQPQKKRGPKPDTKPALTRRQELNRQAQRTHRERKEFYIRSLEREVMQLKEVYSDSIKEKNSILLENSKLRDILRMHGIPFTSTSGQDDPPTSHRDQSSLSPPHQDSGYGYQSSSQYGSQSLMQQPPSHSSPSQQYGSTSEAPAYMQSGYQAAPQHPSQPSHGGGNMDFDQLGVDFVLALEAVCSDHTHMLVAKSLNDPEALFASGHAMMLSCPPHSFIEEHMDAALAHMEHHEQRAQQQELLDKAKKKRRDELRREFEASRAPEPRPLPDPRLGKVALAQLLALSWQLPLEGDGEMTPVMALNWLWDHPRRRELESADWQTMYRDLAVKTKCYGFGAVLEEYELRDALDAVLATKASSYSAFS